MSKHWRRAKCRYCGSIDGERCDTCGACCKCCDCEVVVDRPECEGILPTTIENCVDREISPGVWLITNPTFYPEVQQWRALANVGGALAVVQLRAFIDIDKLIEVS